MLQHKHYVGAAHSFEILKPTDPVAGQYIRPDVTILKTFFINDTVNVNDWQATWEGLKQDAEELPGVPLVLQEDLQHPKFSVQELFDRGTIFDYDIDEENHQIIVYVRITDPKIVERIKSGELQYVSPAVIPRGSETLRHVDGVDVLDRTLPLHLAIVGDPAYGKDKAKMTHLCSGDGEACYNRLKMMTASRAIYSADEDCVSRKIKIIMKERPNISQDQAIAMAYSMCKEKNGNGHGDSGTGIKSKLKIHNADGITELEQIPLIKKMIASVDRISSTLDKIKTGSVLYSYDGKQGRWINAQNMDVFVAVNQTIKSAILEQCGCARIASNNKHTKKESNYHKTPNEKINCSTCKFFNESQKTCDVVEGEIGPYFISDLYRYKE